MRGHDGAHRSGDEEVTKLIITIKDRDQQLAEQLQNALASRSLIDQAIGVLMAQERCDSQEAFELLKRHSQNNNRKLRDVAADVITRLTGHPPTAPAPFAGRTHSDGDEMSFS
jgi:hypothetical protein